MAPSSPDLIALYQDYLDAFNERSLSEVLKHLSSRARCTVRGRLISSTVIETTSAYERDFTDRDGKPVVIKEIKEIESEGGKGVFARLSDQHQNKIVEVNYWYEKEADGVWRHVWHEILAVVDE